MIARPFALTASLFFTWVGVTPAAAASPDELLNGSFEEASSDPTIPLGWTRQSYVGGASLTWDADTAHGGLRSARISNATLNDAAWTQTVTLEPDRNYLLSGWIRTENVAHVIDGVDAGANLCIWGTWQRTPALTGSNDWTYVRLVFNSGATGVVTICARVGYWAGVTTGRGRYSSRLRLDRAAAGGRSGGQRCPIRQRRHPSPLERQHGARVDRPLSRRAPQRDAVRRWLVACSRRHVR